MNDLERRFSAVFDGAADAMLLIGDDRRFVDVNAAACELFGLTRDELLGRCLVELFSDDDRDAVDAAWNSVLAAGRTAGEFARRGANGETRHVEYTATAHICPELHLAILRDVTARVETESALRHSERRFRTNVETQPECVKLVAPDGTLLEMNPAGLTMLEAGSIDEVRGARVLDVIAPEHRAAFQDLHEAVCAGESRTLEFELVGLAGTRRWVSTTAAPLRDDSGEIVAHLAVTRDITARRETEAALRESERRYRELFENANDVVATLALDSTITAVNRKFEEVLGYSREEVVGRNLLDFLSPASQLDAQRQRDSKLAGRAKTTTYELEHVAKDGRFVPLEVSSRLIEENGEPVAIQGVARDRPRPASAGRAQPRRERP